VSRTLQKRETRQQLLDEANNVMNTMADKISNASGWFGGDTLSIDLLDKGGMPVKLYWGQKDSGLYYGDRPLLAKGTRTTWFKLWYLPVNDSVSLYPKEDWFNELDYDRSGLLESLEIKRASNVEISLKASAQGQHIFLKSTVRLPKPVTDTTGY